MKKSEKDYQTDKNGNFILDEDGFMIRKKLSSSSKAERGRSAGMMRVAAKKSALATIRNKKKNQIPASPTR